jgi:hypothetical protein
MTTQMRLVEPKRHIQAYMMIKLNKDGNFIELKPTYGTHKIMGGYWASLEEVQHEQMVKALLDEQYRVFEVTWEI